MTRFCQRCDAGNDLTAEEGEAMSEANLVPAAVRQYTADELQRWWPAKCPKCGWRGLSCDCSGGGQIADTGDYGDVECPQCVAEQEKIMESDDVNAAEAAWGGVFPVEDDEDYEVFPNKEVGHE